MQESKTVITTPRLHLSDLDPDDDSHIAYRVHLANSPNILAQAARFGQPARPLTFEAARAILQAAGQRMDKNGFGRYLVSLRKSDRGLAEESEEKQRIGIVSMQLNRYPDMQCPLIPDIGFAFHEDYHGRGFASEACEVLMKYFREVRGHEQIAGFTHPENVKCQALFRRLGFENRGVVEVAGVGGADGSAMATSVWLKGVEPDMMLSELGIGPGTGVVSKVGRDGILAGTHPQDSR